MSGIGGKLNIVIGNLSIYDNGSEEIFIEHIPSGICTRTRWTGNNLLVTAQKGRLNPTSINGKSAFSVTEK